MSASEATETVFSLTVPQVVFGAGASREAGFHLKRLGVTRALLVTDSVLAGLGVPDPVVEAIRAAGIDVEVYVSPAGEPSVSSMQAAGDHARAGGYDGFVGLGGGSSLDTVKVCALMATHGGELMDYVNPPIGAGKPVPGPLLPVVALPTTAGTGSEVTAVAILDVPEHHVKTGIAHQLLRPRLAINDPELTVGCPPAVTAAVGLDALMHAIEAYTAIPFDARPRSADPAARPPYQGANPLCDIWVERAIELGGKHLRNAVADGTDVDARLGMMQCATYAGIGFGNAGVHVPHACSYPIAGLRHDWSPPGFPGKARGVPHGIAVIVTAAAGLRLTEPALPERHRRAAEMLTGTSVEQDDRDALPRALEELMRDVGSPSSLAAFDFTADDIPALIEGALKQQRLLSIAPLPVGEAELEQVLTQSL